MSSRNLMLDDPAEYYRQIGAGQERERIIKDLEANEHIWRERVVLTALKALIKGGQK